jgi:hypothetical protein
MLSRIVATMFLVALVHVPAAAAVARDDGCQPGEKPHEVGGGAFICIPAEDPGEPPKSGDGQQQSGHSGCFRVNGKQVPCKNEDGVWFAGYDCYASPYDLPPGDPAWQGHEGEVVWQCIWCDSANQAANCNVQFVWLPVGGSGGTPDPGQLAQSSVGQLGLRTADVHTAPQDPNVGVVGVETWLWVPAAQWVTLSKTVTAGATAVTVTAVPERVTWDVGPETKVCNGGGKAWVAGMGDSASTSCGFTYTSPSKGEPDGVFAISARIGYRVDWTCTGTCLAPSGSLGIVDAPAGGGRLRVVQRQTVVVTE